MSPRKRSKRSSSSSPRLLRLLAWAMLAMMLVAGGWVLYLDIRVQSRLEGRQWDLPTRIYARPLELYAGLPLTPEQLILELEAAGYHANSNAAEPGYYSRNGNRFLIHRRGFRFSDGVELPGPVRVTLAGGRIASLEEPGAEPLTLARLDPARIGSIYPSSNEDREVVVLSELPPLLIAGLLAVEDRRFTRHHGLDFRGLARALLANLRAGEVTQGGSTITQQLAKNLFLSDERTLTRKANEAVMALLIELHADKDEILEMYINEVFLAQQGSRAIHGFGLGARHFFGRPLDQLEVPELALLIGLIKGPSYYHPRRHPERALARRNSVLRTMVEYEVLDERTAARAQQAPLGVAVSGPPPERRYADFLDLVRRHLLRDYREQDLQREGLRVITTMAPYIQAAAQQTLDARIEAPLQGAVVVAEPNNGELLALVGSRSDSAGFNRAIDAHRQVGSAFKPFVYLEALNRPQDYTLATLIDDSLFSVETRDGVWTPRNASGRYHGDVLLIDALSRSLNAATARLGQEINMRSVFSLVERLGAKPRSRPFPSAALGAVEFSPLELTQLYQGIAAGGFPVPLTTLREVLDNEGDVLDRYGLQLNQMQHPAATYLLSWALTEVTRSGTGRALANHLGGDFLIAGKTGTSNEERDAWFAGFTADRLAVVWLGRDDNQAAGVSGASGALPVFGELMRQISAAPLQLIPPADIVSTRIDRNTGLLADSACDDVIELPFLRGSAPEAPAPCARGGGEDSDRPWWRRDP